MQTSTWWAMNHPHYNKASKEMTEMHDPMTKEEIIAIGKSVIEIEAEALRKMSFRLDNDFIAAVYSLIQITPWAKTNINDLGSPATYAVVIGMGKSGHMGKKMAATLSSTGTPCFFVHPGEAIHGDLGMIVPHTPVILISNSGETDEVLKILPFLKDQECRIIAITGNPDSTLGRNANMVLNSSAAQEACPHQLAPSSSTTTALAMGDALAIAVMRYTGFQPEDFAKFHPGGSLGQKLLGRVTDYVEVDDDLALNVDSEMSMIFEKFDLAYGFVPVTGDDGQLVGIITDGDFRRHIAKCKDDGLSWDNATCEDIMSKDPRVVSIDATMDAAYQIMEDSNITRLLVVDSEKRYLGFVRK